MDETTKTQMADFLSIALESLESDNPEVAKGFVEDAYEMVVEDLEEE
jgi:hypothetical protein